MKKIIISLALLFSVGNIMAQSPEEKAALKEAKKAAKENCNLRNGLAGNWIDFQLLGNPNSQNLDMLREQSETTEKVRVIKQSPKTFSEHPKALCSFKINGFRGIIEASNERKNKDASTESEPDQLLFCPV